MLCLPESDPKKEKNWRKRENKRNRRRDSCHGCFVCLSSATLLATKTGQTKRRRRRKRQTHQIFSNHTAAATAATVMVMLKNAIQCENEGERMTVTRDGWNVKKMKSWTADAAFHNCFPAFLLPIFSHFPLAVDIICSTGHTHYGQQKADRTWLFHVLPKIAALWVSVTLTLTLQSSKSS